MNKSENMNNDTFNFSVKVAILIMFIALATGVFTSVLGQGNTLPIVNPAIKTLTGTLNDYNNTSHHLSTVGNTILIHGLASQPKGVDVGWYIGTFINWINSGILFLGDILLLFFEGLFLVIYMVIGFIPLFIASGGFGVLSPIFAIISISVEFIASVYAVFTLNTYVQQWIHGH
jgi:hypothetical protein